MRQKRTTEGRRLLGLLLSIFTVLVLIPTVPAYASGLDDWYWGDEWGEAYATCDDCGITYMATDCHSSSDAESELSSYFCEGCGRCSQYGNDECYAANHCYVCGDCLDGDFFDPLYEAADLVICDNCAYGARDDYPEFFCKFCGMAYDIDVEECDCEYSLIEEHCTDCHGDECQECHFPFEVGGEDTNMPGCREHGLCELHLYDDPDHCNECGSCDMPICDVCGLCEGCYMYEEHCPECDYCFGYGNDIEYCRSGGDHCVNCCEENEWLCENCGECVEGRGMDLCDDCGLCEECCTENSEDAGCSHGYCIASSDYEDHLCPNCQECPEDNECEYCGLCEDCQSDYHCEHGYCPDGFEWEDHLCLDCGDCFDEEELCEYCGKCENCREHCRHDYCPEDPLFANSSNHSICKQCSDCFEGSEGCDECGLCKNCCSANTQAAGCDHGFCVKSEKFAEHWCYEDEQCLEKCNHKSDCAHNRVTTEWETNGEAHWHVCRDCGAAVDKAVHSEGTPVTVTEPNPDTRKNGTAKVSCAVCAAYMSTISIPYVPIPEDGSPYIIIQPKDYEGKVSDVALNDVPRYATFTVSAGGDGLKYQWYWFRNGYNVPLIELQDKRGDGNLYEISGKDEVSGAKTNKLTVFVIPSACYEEHEYYCVITNAKGKVETVHAKLNAQHVFGWYLDKEDGTHSYQCNGDGCAEFKSISKHRYGEWKLVRAATNTQTGLREQKCMDCLAKNSEVIPKVEAGHVHKYDQVHYNATEHWYTCACGVTSPDPHQAHLWDKTTVITQPTEKRTGKKEISCSKCGITKTETIDKLPHTHQWWTKETIPSNKLWVRKAITTQSGSTGYISVPNTDYWGRSTAQHYFKCKTCDEINSMGHTWSYWSVKRKPSATEDGRMYHRCVICNMEEYKNYPSGTNPIMIIGGTADKDYAKAYETVTITFDPVSAKYGFEDNPCEYDYVKLKEWCDLKKWDGDGMIDFAGSWATVPRITFANNTSQVTTFTMPSGPAVIIASVEECKHNVGTGWNDQVNPTCTNYGHKRDRVCLGCGKVVIPGDRIEPLGHDLPSTPIAGTSVNKYCSLIIDGLMVPRSTTIHGYAGDFLCNRCGKTVKGANTPLLHGCEGKDRAWNRNFNNVYERRNYVDATCTKDGNQADIYCKLCGKLSERGEKIERLGHAWGAWTVERAATTKIKGREKRVCSHDENHTESRVTDYSGPDYTLKADKTKLNFEWVYGTTPQAQTVTFTSTGRNNVTAITSYRSTSVGNLVKVTLNGLKMTITPVEANVLANLKPGETRSLFQYVATTENGSANISGPEIKLSFNIKKATPTFKFGSAGKSVIAGDKTSSPKITGAANGMTFTWYSSDNSVAVVDAATGEVKALKPGTAVITAKFAGSDYYTSGEAYYTLTVTTPDAIEDIDAATSTERGTKEGTYDLSGRKVKKIDRQGIYIVNGEKEAVKK